MSSLLLFAYAFLLHFVLCSPTASPTTSASTSTTPEFVLATTSAADTCTDISICRTRYTIIWSSLVTIFACVWTAVHRNVPEPERDGESRFWRIVSRVWEAAKIVVVTVLVPEWVLAWAVRQRFIARDVGKELEYARAEVKKKWDAEQEKLKEVIPGRKEGDVGGALSEVAMSRETLPFIQAERVQEAVKFDIVAINKHTGRMRGKWRARHGFSVIMGGFHYYIDGEPQHPLSRWEVPELVRRGDLVPPTDEELRNWSQSDVLSKTIAIVQTLWFIIQTIARRIEGLPVTQLEIMTLAYTTITIAMYVSWWDKPQNVGGPFRVAVKELPRPGPVFEYSWYERISVTVAGAQDMFVDLRKARCVPTFYSGAFDDGNVNIADVVALFAAMVFGAVHCAAWHYAFPSYAERFIWRACSLAIVALPGAIMLVAILPMLMDWLPWSLEMSLLVCAISAPLYVAARSLLLALSFTTLRSLPPETYRAVQWTLRIPHFA